MIMEIVAMVVVWGVCFLLHMEIRRDVKRGDYEGRWSVYHDDTAVLFVFYLFAIMETLLAFG